jgi:hypothetical protein
MQRPTADARRAVREGLAGLRGRPDVPVEYLEFRWKLHDLQCGVWDALVERGATADSSVSGGSGPWTPAEFAPDAGIIEGLLEAIATSLPAGKDPRTRLGGLLDAARESPALLREIVASTAFDPSDAVLEGLAARTDCPAEALLFFGRVLAAPFVTEAVCRPGRGDAPAGGEPALRCPACGAAPGLAVISGERGSRTLCCSLCGTAWTAPRAQCPFCEGTRALGVLEEPGDRTRWLETCDDCGRYLQTVDGRVPGRGGAVLPLVEVTAGLCLDLIAEAHGCRRGLPYASVV